MIFPHKNVFKWFLYLEMMFHPVVILSVWSDLMFQHVFCWKMFIQATRSKSGEDYTWWKNQKIDQQQNEGDCKNWHNNNGTA